MSGLLTVLRGFHPKKDAVFREVIRVAGEMGMQTRMIPQIGLSIRSADPHRVEEAMARAKRQHAGITRNLKRRLISAQYAWARQAFGKGDVAVCWNGLTGSRYAYMQGAHDAGAGRLYAELAPFKNYITLDPNGVNAENSVPRTRAGLGDAVLSEPRREDLANGLTARAARSDRVGQGAGSLPDTPFLFCPLQVPNDSQVQVFGGWASSVEGFVNALARGTAHLPEGWHLRVKEHPSSRISLANALSRAAEEAGSRLVVDNATDTFAQIRASRGIITMNSSLALESFLLRTPVIVTGHAYFAVEGLVSVAASQDALDALLAAPDRLAYDHSHRMALLGYLLDSYFIPTEGEPPNMTLDTERTRAVLHAALS